MIAPFIVKKGGLWSEWAIASARSLPSLAARKALLAQLSIFCELKPKKNDSRGLDFLNPVGCECGGVTLEFSQLLSFGKASIAAKWVARRSSV